MEDQPHRQTDTFLSPLDRFWADIACFPKDQSSALPHSADFTPFLVDRLRHGDIDSVRQLICRLIPAMIAFLASHESDFYEQWAEEAIDEVLRIDFGRYCRSECPDFAHELLAFFLLVNGPHMKRDRGIWIVEGECSSFPDSIPHLFAFCLSCHDIEWFETIEKLCLKANRFIRGMRRESSFWKTFPLIRSATPGCRRIDHLPIAAELRKLPLLARLHLIAFVHSSRSPKHNRTSLLRYSGTTGAMTCLGLNTAQTAPLLVASGICTPNYDPMALIDILSREELVAAFDQRGIAYVKSWGKTEMIKALADRAPDLLEEAAKREMVVSISDSNLAEIRSFAAHAEASADYFKLLCFIKPDKATKRIKRRYHIS
jgi:hypothetical protein